MRQEGNNMNITQLSNKVSVSGQLTSNDISQLADMGIEILICNRPDGEAADQTSYNDIETVAKGFNIECIYLPFTMGNMDKRYIREFLKYQNAGKNIHAYCRTGRRSAHLWEEAQSQANDSSASKVDNKRSNIASERFDVLIVGGGSGGIAMASSLLKRQPKLLIAIVDPAQYHFYQPGWTMVGGGVFDVKTTRRETQDLIPDGVSWIQQSVEGFQPTENKVQLDNGSHIYYQHLVIAPGLKLDWQAVEGLSETLGKNGVTSNYRYDLAPYTWQLVTELKQGKAIFTQPPMPIKCAGAPQKALYLSADHWFKNNLLNNIDIHFYNSGGVLFGVKDYLPALESYMQKYQATLNFNQTLKKVDGENKKAWFISKDEEGNEVINETDFDMLHVCPPQVPLDFIKHSELSDDKGWLEVDPNTLRHTRYDNIWGLGDTLNTPNAKTLAAVRKQVPVVAENITDSMNQRAMSAAYDGYGSCPLTVERGKIVLAEFGYGGKLLPTFPSWINNGLKPTKLAWFLKARMLPVIYWQGMLKGHEWLAKPIKR